MTVPGRIPFLMPEGSDGRNLTWLIAAEVGKGFYLHG
jgi:hypothetical protein